MTSDNINSKFVNVNNEEDLLDDDLDEPSLPKKSDIDKNFNLDQMPDLSSMDFTKIMSSLQSKNPKELRKMISKMGISQAQINQMKQNYENSTDTQQSNLTETDLRKRLREKLNKKRLMRQTNQIKKEHMEKMEADNKTPEVTPTVEPNHSEKTEDIEEIIIDPDTTTTINQTNQTEVSKKTLQNRKKAQRKKEKIAQKKDILNQTN
jgi:hypothetical protein